MRRLLGADSPRPDNPCPLGPAPPAARRDAIVMAGPVSVRIAPSVRDASDFDAIGTEAALPRHGPGPRRRRRQRNS
jgi:hypothetical protein